MKLHGKKKLLQRSRAFAIVASTGNIYSGLWYPIVVAAMSFVVALLFLPETQDRDIGQFEN